MNWAEEIIKTLKDWDTSMVVYVPDISIHQVTSLIDEDPYFRLVSATREEEAIGIAVGHLSLGLIGVAVWMMAAQLLVEDFADRCAVGGEAGIGSYRLC